MVGCGCWMVDAVVGKTRTPHVSRQLSSPHQFLCHHRSAGWVGLPRYNNTIVITQHIQRLRRRRLRYLLILHIHHLQRGNRQIGLRIALATTHRDSADPNQPLISTTTTSPTQHRNHVLHTPQAQQPLPLLDPRAAPSQRNLRQQPRHCHATDGREH